MVITVTSVSFLSKSDVERACGQNMRLWTEVGYAAESGLEHARVLTMGPQEVGAEYWTGDVAQQIDAGNDYYDLAIIRDESDPTDRCNYIIDCNAYRLEGGEKVGVSNLRGELRLDPCIAYWVGTHTRMCRRITINGDMYCGGILGTRATLNGDVFAASSISGEGIEGKSSSSAAEAPVGWPGVVVGDYYPTYYIESSSYSSEGVGSAIHASGAYSASGSNPGGVRYYVGDLELAGGTDITGTLIVDGNVRVSGINSVTAVKNFPAIMINGDLIIEPDGDLTVNGLVIVEQGLEISADGARLNVTGGLFTHSGISEIVLDSSGNGHDGVMWSDIAWQPSLGQTAGALECDGLNDEVIDLDAGDYLNGLSAITISIWVKSDVINQNRGIFFTSSSTGADSRLGIRYNQAGTVSGSAASITASLSATSGYTHIESSSSVQSTNWQHIAIVWESGTGIKLYVNGVLNVPAYDGGAVSGVTTGVDRLTLGTGSMRKFWDGLLDDFRIYNRALDPNDIYPPSDGLSGLATHWRLDEVGFDVDVTAAPCKTALLKWSAGSVAEKWEQVGGAFFRSITRRE
jgi:hypothetical protein